MSSQHLHRGPSSQGRLHLVAPPAAPAARRSLLAWWHLLSLDAPTVSAVWTWFVARACGLHLPWTAPAAMFVAVWMLYVADRLLDARPLAGSAAPAELEERHRFHDRHRRTLLILCSVASVALALLLHWTLPAALHLYTLLAVLLAGWLMLIHGRSSHASHRLPKELAVGLFFPAAVFIPTVARAPQLRLLLAAPALLFAAVCTLNCLCVYAWEHPFDTRAAHPSTRWGTQRLPALAIITTVCGAALTFFLARSHHPTTAFLSAASTSSALLLLLLHHLRANFRRVQLRALADFVLLTPACFVPWLLR